jgi:hypothetical protein
MEGPGGDPKLEDENSLRNLINNLLEERKATSPNLKLLSGDNT